MQALIKFMNEFFLVLYWMINWLEKQKKKIIANWNICGSKDDVEITHRIIGTFDHVCGQMISGKIIEIAFWFDTENG